MAKKTATWKNYQQPISQGQFYTLHESTLEEMVRIRNESLFSMQIPLIELNGTSMCLFNIRSHGTAI